MQEGWKCPQCGQVNAPWQSYCTGCKPYSPWKPWVEPWSPYTEYFSDPNLEWKSEPFPTTCEDYYFGNSTIHPPPEPE